MKDIAVRQRVTITAPDIGVGEMRTTASHIAVLLALDDMDPAEILVSVCKETGVSKRDILDEWDAEVCSECTMSTRFHGRSCSRWKPKEFR